MLRVPGLRSFATVARWPAWGSLPLKPLGRPAVLEFESRRVLEPSGQKAAPTEAVLLKCHPGLVVSPPAL